MGCQAHSLSLPLFSSFTLEIASEHYKPCDRAGILLARKQSQISSVPGCFPEVRLFAQPEAKGYDGARRV